jgi:hypothetical protein
MIFIEMLNKQLQIMMGMIFDLLKNLNLFF